MKKKFLFLLFLLLSIGVTAIIFAVPIVMSINSTDKIPINSTNKIPIGQPISLTQSENYEVVEFVEPKKTVYTMDDVITHNFVGTNDEPQFYQEVTLDCTGMSMTVKHKQTGKTETHDYNGYYFELDGEKVSCMSVDLMVQFVSEDNTLLTPGEYKANVYFITEDGECVIYEMPFTLTD